AALDLLRRRGHERIACLGVSQGGATILLAAEQLSDVRCVVCESVYDELAHAVDNRFRHYFKMPGWLCGCVMLPVAEWRTGVTVNDVRPIAHIDRLRCPLFLISGDEDSKTLPTETERLFQAAVEPKTLWLVPGIGHRDLFSDDYAERVTAFLDRHMKGG